MYMRVCISACLRRRQEGALAIIMCCFVVMVVAIPAGLHTHHLFHSCLMQISHTDACNKKGLVPCCLSACLLLR